jgi:hypothetical protein
MTGFRRAQRRVVAALVGVVVLVSLSGCWVADLADLVPTPGPTPSGHADQLSREQAAALIDQVPGVHALGVGGGTSGFSHYTQVEVRVDDVALAESPEVLEFLFAVGWAMSEFNSPPGVIHLTVWPLKGTGTLLELQPQVNAVFGTTLDPQDGYRSAILQAGVLEERWGPWPGAIPEVPAFASPTPG